MTPGDREAAAARKALEAAITVVNDRVNEWRAAIQNGLKRVEVTKQYAVGAMTEAEVAVANICNIDPAQFRTDRENTP